MSRTLALSGDLPPSAVAVALALTALGLALLAWELARHRGRALPVALSGALAGAALLAAFLRPVRVTSRTSSVGARVVVLVDGSLSMALPGDAQPRADAARAAVRALAGASGDARLVVLSFGQGSPGAYDPSGPAPAPSAARSDLAAALASLGASTDERPAAIVAVSDGRLDLPPGPTQLGERVLGALGALRVPVHTVSVARRVPADASVRAVRAAGAAVAHQPLALTVQVGCDGGLRCAELALSARELLETGSPLVLATATARLEDGQGTVSMPITLDRAGARVIEVGIGSVDGDEIPDNDRRLIALDVARDRVRILHVAGRPTYDVRALRTWLKSDASLDVVAFFILRTMADDVNASPDELALIRFPVEELFSEHLSSFDAVVLQDFNANPYGLAPYLPNLARYVDGGGGLVMVGGLNAFAAGGYAGTPLERVLPVSLPADGERNLVETAPFVPVYTSAGRSTPVLEALRGLLGDDLPAMSGANVLGEPREGSVVLWEHPTLRTAGGRPMPVLALGDRGNGRTLAVGVDDTHELAFSESAVRTAGRGYGLLWDALLGWLMRDPKYEPARVELEGECRAGAPLGVRVRPVPGVGGEARLTLAELGRPGPARTIAAAPAPEGKPLELRLPALGAGGYAARVRIGTGSSTRRDFACERGGDEWADSRPDPARLEAIAAATGGKAVGWRDAAAIPMPRATTVASERHVAPLLPAWVWTLAAAAALGAHWIARRRGGMA